MTRNNRHSLYCTPLHCAITSGTSLTNTARVVSFPGARTQDFSPLAPLTSPLPHHRTLAAAYGTQSYRREFPCCCAHHVTRWNVMGGNCEGWIECIGVDSVLQLIVTLLRPHSGAGLTHWNPSRATLNEIRKILLAERVPLRKYCT